MRGVLLSVLGGLACLPIGVQAASCREVVEKLNQQLATPVEVAALAETLATLGKTGALPPRFVTKREAKSAGWSPGTPFQRIPDLVGKSMGGDRFGNYERRLPTGDWREADLDYRGGKRNAKRLVFSPQRRFVTVDHYQTFTEVAPCQ